MISSQPHGGVVRYESGCRCGECLTGYRRRFARRALRAEYGDMQRPRYEVPVERFIAEQRRRIEVEARKKFGVRS